MTTTQQEESRMIAEYMGGTYKKSAVTLELDKNKIYLKDKLGDDCTYKICPAEREFIYELKYLTSFDWQIPVWAKLRSDYIANWKISDTAYEYRFHAAINHNNPATGFAVLVEAIKTLKW